MQDLGNTNKEIGQNIRYLFYKNEHLDGFSADGLKLKIFQFKIANDGQTLFWLLK